MELDLLYPQASKITALSDFILSMLSVLGLDLNELRFKTLTSITCCISKKLLSTQQQLFCVFFPLLSAFDILFNL